MAQEIRWHYRFRNFSRAFSLLREAVDAQIDELSQLEREGVIQRFEFTFELAWQLLKDRLEYDGIVFGPVTPRNVIREAISARMIDQGETWIDMLVDRNNMSHTYNFATFERVIGNIQSQYLPILNDLYQRLLEEVME